MAVNNATLLTSPSDKELLDGLKTSSDEDLIRQYEYAFYDRFAPYVFKGAVNLCRNFKDSEDLAKEVTQLTFIKAFNALPKFIIGEDVTEKGFKTIVRAWLGKIANNSFKKLYPQLVNENIDIEILQLDEPSYDLFDMLYDPVPEESLSCEMALLHEAMAHLKEIDKHIVLTYASENCLESTHHLSDSSMKLLCETYKTTSDNIRQRKNRALKKIKLSCLKI